MKTNLLQENPKFMNSEINIFYFPSFIYVYYYFSFIYLHYASKIAKN